MSETSSPAPWWFVYIPGWAFRVFSCWNLRCSEVGNDLKLFLKCPPPLHSCLSLSGTSRMSDLLNSFFGPPELSLCFPLLFFISSSFFLYSWESSSVLSVNFSVELFIFPLVFLSLQELIFCTRGVTSVKAETQLCAGHHGTPSTLAHHLSQRSVG